MMEIWMSAQELLIFTNWKVGSPIVFKFGSDPCKRGSIATGVILKSEPELILQYNLLVSLSHLEDVTEN